jgi:segregation and condensation protein A
MYFGIFQYKLARMYRVQLQNFEGPLDLLLFFIRRDELDIYDIPISYITNQFLEYIQFMEELDLGVASEFIYMASTLMSIKAKLMLPREDSGDEPLDEMDPRFELVQSLLEYKRYKEMGDEFGLLDQEARKSFRRTYTAPDQVEVPEDEEPLRDVTLYDLIAAYKLMLNKVVRDEIVHKVQLVKTNIEERSNYIIDTLRSGRRLTFWELCSGDSTRMIVIVTFLAILELVKDHRLELYVGEDSVSFSVSLPSAQKVLSN